MASITSRAARAFVLIAAGVAGLGLQGTLRGQLETSSLPDSIHTELVGRVLGPDGSAASGAVVVSSAGGSVVTGEDGSFRLELALPVDADAVRVTAVMSTGAGNLIASAQVAGAARWGTTDAGVLMLAPSATCQPGWLPTFGHAPGMTDTVHALAVFDDGTGPALYVGGAFDSNGVEPDHIARWDGSAWTLVGTGVNDTVLALAVHDDGSGSALYACGLFTMAGSAPAARVARWDGTSWSAVGGGMDQEVSELAVFDSGTGPVLCAAGKFTLADGLPAAAIAAWDGAQWTALGGGLPAPVRALAAFDDGSGPALYAGGRFELAGGAVPAKNLARWNGSSWSDVGGGVGVAAVDEVFALAAFNDGSGPALAVGGRFSTAGGTPAVNVARWNGSAWAAIGSGLNGTVTALGVADSGSGPALRAGGSFTMAGSVPVKNVATWNGSAWSALAGGLASTGLVISGFDDGSGPAVFVGGAFTTAGGVAALRIAKWQGSSWSAPGHGLGLGFVNALTIFDDGTGPALFAAGAFTSAGGLPVNRIAKWDGATWAPLGSGVNNDAYSLVAFDDGSGPALYVGGVFSTAGGIPVNHVARWDGSSWSALGSGITGNGTIVINALAAFDDGSGLALHAGGNFTSIGGVPAHAVARWDGATWSPLGNGLTEGFQPYAADLLAFDDGSGPALFACGRFLTAGGVSANHIAKWDGTDWASVGGGMDNAVSALSIYDDGTGARLYAAGEFEHADGVPATRIASWDGSNWAALGSGINYSPRALAVYDDGSGPALYVSGFFTAAGGIAANNIARWDGSTWSPLGIGLSAFTNALVVFDDGTGPALIAAGSSPETLDTGVSKWGGCSASPWTDLGFALAGAGGTPKLQGVGSLAVGAPLTLSLTHAAPSALTILFLAGSSAPLPFKGGTLLPVPPLVALSLATNASGGIHLAYPAWPAGASGLSLYFQDAIQDAAAVQGVALSNALRADVP